MAKVELRVYQLYPLGVPQPRLAAAPGAGQRQQPRAFQQPLDLGHLLLAANEAGELDGEVVGIGIQRLERRELGRQVWVEQLIHLLRLDQVAQAVLARVMQTHPGRQCTAHQIIRRLRQQDLATMSDCAQTGIAVDG